MKLAVCSLAIGEKYKKAVELCTNTLVKYCEKQKYPLITEETYAIHDRDYMWSKIPLLRKTLPDYDYLVWIDGDMMIMNDNFRLEKYIEHYLGNKEIMMSIDVGGQINTGFCVVKNTPYMNNLLEMIQYLPELAGEYHEQGVFNRLYEKDMLGLVEKSRIIPETEQRLFNASMCNFVIGDFLIHFLGIRDFNKLSIVSNDHYPFKKDTETQQDYEDRQQWLKDIYTNIRNYRYLGCPQKAKIEVCTFFTGNKYVEDTIRYGQRSMKMYCEKYNYEYHVSTDILEKELPPHWTKIALLLKLCKERDCDYLAWFDADVMIINHDISIEDIILEHMHGKDFLLSRDISNEINTGVWIIRNTEYTRNMLELILKLPELRYRGCEDQDSFNKVYCKNIMKFQEHASILPINQQHIMNCCVGCYKWGVWLIHFFSLSKDGLTKSFNDFYPFKRDNENDDMYNFRLNWVKNR